MSPAVSWRQGSQPRDGGKAAAILLACQTAATYSDFNNFLTMEIWTGRHTSMSDKQNHATVRVKTTIQTRDGKHQVAHIYMTETYSYTGHNLYPNVKND